MKFSVVCTVIVLSAALLGNKLVAQINVSAGIGYGTYSQKDLKDLQQSFKSSSPVAMKQMSAYPSYFNYGGRIEYELTKSFGIGLIVEYGSSGSRLDYHDYSGYMQYDQVARYWRWSSSVSVSKSIFNNKFILELEVQPGMTYTNLNIVNKIKIGNNNYSTINQFSSANFSVQPSIAIKKPYKNFTFYSYLGLNADIAKGKLIWSEDSDYYLEDDSGNEVHANWTGLRTGIGIKYHFEL